MGIRKGEPRVIQIRLVCRVCRDEILYGRRWWRKNVKGMTDAFAYGLFQGHECTSCARKRRESENFGRYENQRKTKEAAIAICETLNIPKSRWIEFGI